MNLKERGITVGDLLIFIVIIISTFLIISKIKENDKQSYFYIIPNEISSTNAN
tara:strand:+ start:226 stop:384 length:159 start_codon:yes stop_codon:yes gene_type:complete